MLQQKNHSSVGKPGVKSDGSPLHDLYDMESGRKMNSQSPESKNYPTKALIVLAILVALILVLGLGLGLGLSSEEVPENESSNIPFPSEYETCVGVPYENGQSFSNIKVVNKMDPGHLSGLHSGGINIYVTTGNGYSVSEGIELPGSDSPSATTNITYDAATDTLCFLQFKMYNPNSTVDSDSPRWVSFYVLTDNSALKASKIENYGAGELNIAIPLSPPSSQETGAVELIASERGQIAVQHLDTSYETVNATSINQGSVFIVNITGTQSISNFEASASYNGLITIMNEWADMPGNVPGIVISNFTATISENGTIMLRSGSITEYFSGYISNSGFIQGNGGQIDMTFITIKDGKVTCTNDGDYNSININPSIANVTNDGCYIIYS